MKLLILCLLVCACAGTDAKPDEFNVQFGHGDSDGATGARAMDSETDWASVGWTWHLGDVAEREHEDAFAEFMRTWKPEVTVKQEPPAPSAEPQAVPKPEPVLVSEEPKPEHSSPWWSALLPYLPALAIAAIAVLNRLGKVDWLDKKTAH